MNMCSALKLELMTSNMNHVNSTVYKHLLMPNLDTSWTVMFLESLDVSGLSTSYALLQVTQPGLIRPQLVSRWLASYHDSPLLSHSHLEALSAASVVLWMALLFLSPSMPKLLKALAKERAANPLHPTSTGNYTLLSNQPADSHWPVLRTWKASSQRLLPSDLPTGLSAPAALLAWWTQTQGQCLVAGWWLQYGWGTSADVQGPPTTASLLQTSGCLQKFFWQELACHQLWQRQWFSWRVGTPLPTPVLRWWLQQWSWGLGHASTCTDHLQVPLYSNWGCVPGFLTWNTVGMLVSLLCPMCADLTGLEARHTLPGWGIWCGEAGLSKAQPRSLSFQPHSPSSLLLHSHCLAGSHLLHCCSHLLLNKSSPFLLSGVHLGSWKGS